jgi:glycosyltransferase involved in cell wall biosynthesis
MNVGGTELNALRTARRLLGRGIDLSVFSLSREGPLLAEYAELGIPVEILPLTTLFGPGTITAGRCMSRIIRRRAVQIVHAHDLYSNIFAGFWTRLAGASFIASRRWWEGHYRTAQRWANRTSYLLADRVLANSPSVASLLIRGERVRSSSVVVIPNFLDEAAFDPPPVGWREAFAKELGLPDQRFVVGVVASLSAIKDHATLLRAAPPLCRDWPQLYFVLVGADNGSRESLERLVADLGITERVRFAGLRPNHPSAHHLFDVSVLTSISEGMPNSILEAMACARPVVATAVGGVPDAVQDGVNGYLIPPGDDAGLGTRLDSLLRDPALARRFGLRGQQLARERYSAGNAIGRLVDLYRSLA